MSVTTETTPGSLRGLRRRVGDIILRASDKIDPPADVKHARTFQEFEVLSRKAHAGEARADLLIEETQPGEFSLGATLVSWRGQDADKVVLHQQFQEGISGSLEGPEGEIMQARLLFTVDKELERFGKIFPRTRKVLKFSVVRLGSPGKPGKTDLADLEMSSEQWQRLEPLTPIEKTEDAQV